MWSSLTLMLWHFLFHGCHVEYVFKTHKVENDLKSLDFQSSRNKTKCFIMMKVSCHANEQQINHKIIHTRFVLPSTSLSIRTFWNHNNLCKIIVNVNSIQSLYHNWYKRPVHLKTLTLKIWLCSIYFLLFLKRKRSLGHRKCLNLCFLLHKN